MSRALLKSSGIVSAMTLLSRIAGFARDAVIAAIFGADANTDAFYAAQRIPNTLRRFFGEGGFALSFVPVFSEYKTQRGNADMHRLADNVAGTLGLIVLGISIIGSLLAPWLIYLIAAGFSKQPGQIELAGDLLRITFPYLFFISLTACAGGILNTLGRFAIPAFTPVLLNISLILSAIYLSPHFEEPVTALAWGVFIAGAAQLALQIPFLKKAGMLPRPRWGWHSEGVRRIIKLMIPTLFGSSVGQINILLSTLLASMLVSGSVSWLYYSDRLVELPLGLIAVALGTVILPKLSKLDAMSDPAQFSNTMDWAMRWVIVIGSAAMVGLVLLSGPLLATLFQRGAFEADDVAMARQSLMAYALGLQALMMVKVLAPGFYARKDTRTPVRIAIYSLVASMVVSLILVYPLKHVGLALATAIAGTLNATMLLNRLRADGIYQPGAGWKTFLIRVIFANIAMGLVLYFTQGNLEFWTSSAEMARVTKLTWIIVLGAAIYGSTLWLAGLRKTHLRM